MISDWELASKRLENVIHLFGVAILILIRRVGFAFEAEVGGIFVNDMETPRNNVTLNARERQLPQCGELLRISAPAEKILHGDVLRLLPILGSNAECIDTLRATIERVVPERALLNANLYPRAVQNATDLLAKWKSRVLIRDVEGVNLASTGKTQIARTRSMLVQSDRAAER